MDCYIERPEFCRIMLIQKKANLIFIVAFGVAVLLRFSSIGSTFLHNLAVSSLLFSRTSPSHESRVLFDPERLEKISVNIVSSEKLQSRGIDLPRILFHEGKTKDAVSIIQSDFEYVNIFTALFVGEELWSENNKDLAMKLWQGIPNIDMYFLFRGLEFAKLGQFESALIDFEIGNYLEQEISPQKGGIYVEYAELFRSHNQSHEALIAANKALESGNVFWASQILGHLYMDEKDFASAEEYYRQAYQINPSGHRVAVWLGVALSRQKKYKESIIVLKQALLNDPTDGFLNFELGRALYSNNEYCEAGIYFESSMDLATDTQNWDTHYLTEVKSYIEKIPDCD